MDGVNGELRHCGVMEAYGEVDRKSAVGESERFVDSKGWAE